MEILQRTLQALDWDYILEALAKRARTSLGRGSALALEPLNDIERISELFDAVDDTAALFSAERRLPPLSAVEDIREDLSRAARGEVLDLERLAVVATSIAGLAELSEFLATRRQSAPTLADWAALISVDALLAKTMAAAFDIEGRLSEKTYPLLGELRRRITALERRARQTLEGLMAAGGELAVVLQDDYVTMRGDRLVVPIKAGAKNIGLGIVHDSSRSGQTVYLEPQEIVAIGNQRRLAEGELAAEQLRILRELSAQVGGQAEALADGLRQATAIDMAVARFQLARDLDATRPQVAADAVIRLCEARHPLLALEGGEVVANDLALDAAQPVLVLSGPNAGGKTVALKTIGLCAMLVRIGCFVPAAKGSRVGLFDEILADIGDQQSVHGGLSSFSGHLLALREMLARSGPAVLLLLDELASGTDPAQGGALARALIERFASSGARVVATTHYAQLKAMAASDRRVSVAAMEYRDEQPTYRVVAGVAGDSHGLAAALRAGLDVALVERARELMGEGERALHEALEALESERARSAELAHRAEVAAAAAARREASLAQRELRIKVRAEKLEQEAAAAFVGKLRSAEAEIARLIAELQREPSAQKAAAVRGAVASMHELPRQAAGVAACDEDELPPAGLPEIGERVRVRRLGLSGEVTRLRGSEIEISAGSVSVRVKASEIERSGCADAPRRRSLAPPRSVNTATSAGLGDGLRVAGNTLDLRGERVAEGLLRLERYLDEAVLAGHHSVFVIHGHGSGAMKTAVREALSLSAYVSRWAPASPDQGGDGVSVVVLKD